MEINHPAPLTFFTTSVFSGAGAKTKAAKLKDIDLAMADYNKWLQKYKDDPSEGSPPKPQVSQVNFRTGTPPTSIIGMRIVTGKQIGRAHV